MVGEGFVFRLRVRLGGAQSCASFLWGYRPGAERRVLRVGSSFYLGPLCPTGRKPSHKKHKSDQEGTKRNAPSRSLFQGSPRQTCRGATLARGQSMPELFVTQQRNAAERRRGRNARQVSPDVRQFGVGHYFGRIWRPSHRRAHISDESVERIS
jgi:hypothetical protein